MQFVYGSEKVSTQVISLSILHLTKQIGICNEAETTASTEDKPKRKNWRGMNRCKVLVQKTRGRQQEKKGGKLTTN